MNHKIDSFMGVPFPKRDPTLFEMRAMLWFADMAMIGIFSAAGYYLISGSWFGAWAGAVVGGAIAAAITVYCLTSNAS